MCSLSDGLVWMCTPLHNKLEEALRPHRRQVTSSNMTHLLMLLKLFSAYATRFDPSFSKIHKGLPDVLVYRKYKTPELHAPSKTDGKGEPVVETIAPA